MFISSRTPEGDPNRCTVCGTKIKIEPSEPTRDAPCPACGHLNWWAPRSDVHGPAGPGGNAGLQSRIVNLARSGPQVDPAENLDQLVESRIDTIERMMIFEQEFDIEIPDEEAEKITTVAAAVAYLESRQQELGTHESD